MKTERLGVHAYARALHRLKTLARSLARPQQVRGNTLLAPYAPYMRSMLQQCPGYCVHAQGIILGMSRYIYARTHDVALSATVIIALTTTSVASINTHQRADVGRGSFE